MPTCLAPSSVQQKSQDFLPVEQALTQIQALYALEQDIRDQNLTSGYSLRPPQTAEAGPLTAYCRRREQ
jgi:hypothetical protein